MDDILLKQKKIKFLTNRGLRELNLLFEDIEAVTTVLPNQQLDILLDFLQEEDIDIYYWLLNLYDSPEKYASLINIIRSKCISKVKNTN